MLALNSPELEILGVTTVAATLVSSDGRRPRPLTSPAATIRVYRGANMLVHEERVRDEASRRVVVLRPARRSPGGLRRRRPSP
jgi:hypothetical protein